MDDFDEEISGELQRNSLINHYCQMLPRLWIRLRVKHIIAICLTLFLLDYFGAFTHMFEEDFNTDFHYPYDGDALKYAKQIRHGQQPDVAPINRYNYTYLSDCSDKCRRPDADNFLVPRLVFVIKSAMEHFSRRSAIRQSWGYENRFSDVIIRTVFVLGIPSAERRDIQPLIDIEQANFKDIVQADFLDTYFNNTIKTMMGIQWAATFCPRGKFFMFVDDDFYVSAKNVLRFLRNPVNYPEYLEEADETLRKLARRLSQSDLLAYNNSLVSDTDADHLRNLINQHSIHTVDNKQHINQIRQYLDKKQQNKSNNTVGQPPKMGDDTPVVVAAAAAADTASISSRKLLDMELPNNVRLFAGFVFSSAPHRHKSSKWFVSLDEYPWHMWPPYVTAGAYILSREALFDFYYVSMYTKHFR